MFGLHLVKTGKIDKEFAKIFTAEQEDREIGDYDIDIVFEEERAKQRVNESGKFLKAIEGYINSIKQV